jgi:excisionase family DNA binding protein
MNAKRKQKAPADSIGDRLLTLREAAEVLRLNLRTVREYVARRELQGRIIGGRWRFRRTDLDAFYENAPSEWDFAEKTRRRGLDGGAKKTGRGWHQHFIGFWARLNCEEMAVIPAWLVRRCVEDPRRIPYLLVWKDSGTAELKRRCGWRATLIRTTFARHTITWK